MSPTTVTLGEYLFTRLRQLGVGSIFGVPGDYNLRLLDYVEPSELKWIGTCNELNGGYATDGYARIKGIGALITTFGVGELSAVNAIAGSYTELVPVVHIVGTPMRSVQDSRALVHHTLCDGDFGRFAKMYEQVTAAQVDLRDLSTCTEQVDWILSECLRTSRPVYIRLPDDMAVSHVSAERLQSVKVAIPPAVSSSGLDRVVDLILERMQTSQKPAILVDGESRAFGILKEIDFIIKQTSWPTWTSGFGKGLVNETYPNVLGIYQGNAQKSQKAYIDAADLVLNFGPHYSRTNTYFGSSIPNSTTTIAFRHNSVVLDGKTYEDVPVKSVLSRIIDAAQSKTFAWSSVKIDAALEYEGEPIASVEEHPPGSALLNQTYMWPIFNPLIQSGDVVFCETGTAAYGGRSFKLPPNTHFLTSVTWLSIGYMLPAALGTAQALRERHTSAQGDAARTNGDHLGGTLVQPRTHLFIGDGSLQLTVQEISTMIAQKLNITVVVINNDGYTIERCIHGLKQKYNDIVEWNYLKAPELFSKHGLKDPDYPVRTFTAKTFGELQHLVSHDLSSRQSGFTMVEVFVEREDAPMYLRAVLDQQIKGQARAS